MVVTLEAGSFFELVAEPNPLVVDKRLETLEGAEEWIQKYFGSRANLRGSVPAIWAVDDHIVAFAEPGGAHCRAVYDSLYVSIPTSQRGLIITVQEPRVHRIQTITHLVDVVNVSKVPVPQIVILVVEESLADKFVGHRVFPRPAIEHIDNWEFLFIFFTLILI